MDTQCKVNMDTCMYILYVHICYEKQNKIPGMQLYKTHT